MFGNGHKPLRGPGRKKQIGFDHFGERAVGEIGLRIDQGFAGLDNVPNRPLPTLINARHPRDHQIVQFLLLVHFIKPSDRKNSVRSFRTMSDDVCSWRCAAFANAARIDFAGSRCRRFRHTLKRFGSFARHDLAKLIFVSDKV